MRKTILSILVMLVSLPAFASFPVANQATTLSTVVSIDSEDQTLTSDSHDTKASAELDDKTMLLLLWFFLGSLAAHRWYSGKPAMQNILFMITGGGFGIWWILDGLAIWNDKW